MMQSETANGIDPSFMASRLPGPDPSGPNLEYDPDFLALERAQHGRPEQVIGDSIKPGEDPNWSDVRERAESLLTRARDLRVAMSLTRALLHTEGFPGLATGLGIIRALLEGQWETVHPQLDAEEGNDPTSRINSLMGLTASDGLLKALRESPIVSSPTLGRVSLRDVRIATGKQPIPAGLAEPPQRLQITAALREAALAVLEGTATAVAGAFREGVAIEGLLADKVGAEAPELKPLLGDLTEISQVLGEQLRARGVAGAAATGIPAPDAPAPPSVTSDEVSTRDDVVRQLERICEYYRQHEPSSPLPLLLQRAKRLVSKDFMTIIRDLAPSGVAEAESIGGLYKNSD